MTATPLPLAATTRRTDALLPVFIAAFCIIWSSAFAVAKVALADCPPLLLLSARFLVAGLVVLVGCALLLPASHFRRLDLRDVAALSAMGILNNAVYLGLSYVGMTHVSSGFTAVLVSANPLLTALGAAVLLGERLTGRKLLGLVLGMIGVAIVVRSRIVSGHEDPLGTAYVVGALLALTAATLMFKKVRTSASLFVAAASSLWPAGLRCCRWRCGGRTWRPSIPRSRSASPSPGSRWRARWARSACGSLSSAAPAPPARAPCTS